MKHVIRVPATSANLGPGFDSFGCALGIYNTYTIQTADALTVCGCPERYRNERNLTVRAYRAVLEEAGAPFRGLTLQIDARIPVARGLGSSAAMVAGGILAANADLGKPYDRRKLLQIGTKLEGHPDNLAPALFGGLTASMTEDGVPDTVRYLPAPDLRFVVCVPDFELSTAKARKALPETVPLADAVYNLSHGTVLLKAMETGDKQVIRRAMRDRLHQPCRVGLIPEYEAVRAAAEEAGALGFCISGAGPTLLALTDDEAFASRLEEKLKNRVRHRWTVLSPALDRAGAQVREEA